MAAPRDVPFQTHTGLMTPTATGTVDAFMGLTWRPGGGARRPARERLSPVADVANNTEMPIDLAIP